MPGVVTFLLVMLCGGIGAASRFLLDGAISRHNRTGIPLGTLVINVTACLLIGLLTGWAISIPWAGTPTVRFILGTGLLGGFSTFSTASVDGFRLLQQRHYLRVLVYLGGMLLLSVAAEALGMVISETLFL